MTSKKKTQQSATESEIQTFAYELRLPKERVAVLIGTNGQTKKTIERNTKTKLDINSEEGEVKISGQDALFLYLAREIIRAIGRGFNPEIAQHLLKPDYMFELITLNEHAKNPHDVQRLKGRIIGEKGKSRNTIEELTQTKICVYGKTAGIIGSADSIMDARKAIQRLLEGSTHASVYRWLERRKKERKTL
ncbi:RNA-processing protein [Candidatus Woesearchaeota archaeon CG10_big_fil_rev_8_21_14_0_10_37_12]|nr:MAG: RNA-processing protein [Candidatus Woesearchaeota archaeon CG10_big_fil_rev_8_21_14_0_10_37_12]